MQKHDFPKSNFKGFMANSTKANWNVLIIVYGSKDPFVRMIDKKRTCLFHWIQSLNKHTKQMIKLEFQNQHIFFCHQYRGTKSLREADSLYVLICYCSFKSAFEASVHELGNWFNFWHFGVKQ
jgi:hypothetical protein